MQSWARCLLSVNVIWLYSILDFFFSTLDYLVQILITFRCLWETVKKNTKRAWIVKISKNHFFQCNMSNLHKRIFEKFAVFNSNSKFMVEIYFENVFDCYSVSFTKQRINHFNRTNDVNSSTWVRATFKSLFDRFQRAILPRG